MSAILEKLFKAADNHGEDSGEPDHTVGDLQDLLKRAWDILAVDQKIELLNSDEVENLIEMGAQGEFDVERLLAELEVARQADYARLAKTAEIILPRGNRK